MERTIYEVIFMDNTIDYTAAPACAIRKEVREAYISNNADKIKTHGSICKFTRVNNYYLSNVFNNS